MLPIPEDGSLCIQIPIEYGEGLGSGTPNGRSFHRVRT